MIELNNRITIFTGHFGSGKTELAINFAFSEREKHEKVAITDLDVINPYFRSRDVSNSFEEKDIQLISPPKRLATSDLPIVSGEIYRVLFDERYRILIDAGGDKDGATALGQYYNEWKNMDVGMIFVLNANRPYVSTVEGVLDTISRIEEASRIKVTGLINNTNIASETTVDIIQKGNELAEFVCGKKDIPFLCTTVSEQFKQQISELSGYPIQLIKRHMKAPWDM